MSGIADETDLAHNERTDDGAIAWPALLGAWGGAFLARVVVFMIAAMLAWGLGLQGGLPDSILYIVFVPSSAVCALVAGWAYPQRPLLAAIVPLLLPPDYGAPVGLAVGGAMARARTRRQRVWVTVVAMVLVLITYGLPILPALSGLVRPR